MEAPEWRARFVGVAPSFVSALADVRDARAEQRLGAALLLGFAGPLALRLLRVGKNYLFLRETIRPTSRFEVASKTHPH
jgi:hypothetical protein